MAGQRVLLLVGFFFPGILFSESAKILTLSAFGGSHYLLMDRASQILQKHGHQVTMLWKGNFISSKEISYQVISWLLSENQKEELRKNLDFYSGKICGWMLANLYLPAILSLTLTLY
uniref:Uncharacterized protein n=1 Tax=Castor canadensis TaxID=51338 RepID=A0A8C0XD02_CASCN